MNLLLNLDVPDLPRAVEFYRRALGLRAARYLFDGSVVEMLGAALPLYLLHKAHGSQTAGQALRDYRRHWTPLHLDFVVDDLDMALARAIAAGATQEGEIVQQSWGRLVTLSDPFGHGFCLLQWLGNGYEGVNTKQELRNEDD